MSRVRAGRLVVLGLTLFSGVVFGVVLWRLSDWGMREIVLALLGPSPAGPYFFAVGLLPFLLVKRLAAARRAAAAVFGVSAVAGVLWWILMAEPLPGGFAARLIWFAVVPAVFTAALYAPAVSHLISAPSEAMGLSR